MIPVGRTVPPVTHSRRNPDEYPLFTNFGYDNLGIPKNPDNPYYAMPPMWNPDGESWVDYGLGGYMKSAGYTPDVYETELGKFKIPSLRNVDLRPTPDFVKAYGHNGYFKSLDEIVLFYAWRGLTMNGGLGLGGSGMDCGMMGGGMGGWRHVDDVQPGTLPTAGSGSKPDADEPFQHDGPVDDCSVLENPLRWIFCKMRIGTEAKMGTPKINRREFLRLSGLGAAALFTTGLRRPSLMGEEFMPDAVINVTAKEKWVQILSGSQTRVWSYEGQLMAALA